MARLGGGWGRVPPDQKGDGVNLLGWARTRPGYAWSAVVHRERGGGAHAHVLAARCDLETGRSLSIAPAGWRKTFDPLRDAFNAEHGWSRPDDPERARVEQPGHRAYIEAARLRAGLGLEAEPRDLIRDYLLQRVEHGAVRNRADVVAVLREAGLEGAAPGRPDRSAPHGQHPRSGRGGIRTHAGNAHTISSRAP